MHHQKKHCKDICHPPLFLINNNQYVLSSKLSFRYVGDIKLNENYTVETAKEAIQLQAETISKQRIKIRTLHSKINRMRKLLDGAKKVVKDAKMDETRKKEQINSEKLVIEK